MPLLPIIIIIMRTRSRRWTVALSTPPDNQRLFRPSEQLNVSLLERHVTRYITVFLAFFANQNVVLCRFLAGVWHVRTEPAFCHWWLHVHVCLVDLSLWWLPSWLQSLTTGCLECDAGTVCGRFVAFCIQLWDGPCVSSMKKGWLDTGCVYSKLCL